MDIVKIILNAVDVGVEGVINYQNVIHIAEIGGYFVFTEWVIYVGTLQVL